MAFTSVRNGTRQIFAFHHPGDFVALHGFLYPGSTEIIEVEALSNCSIGAIDRDVLERSMQDHPELGQTLWQAAMNEASVFRQRLVMARWPAQQRVAHLLCEQLSRLGPKTSVIPINQIEVADTVGLSVVHTNRVTDFESWGIMREYHEMSFDDACGIWIEAIDRLLPPTPDTYVKQSL